MTYFAQRKELNTILSLYLFKEVIPLIEDYSKECPWKEEVNLYYSNKYVWYKIFKINPIWCLIFRGGILNETQSSSRMVRFESTDRNYGQYTLDREDGTWKYIIYPPDYD